MADRIFMADGPHGVIYAAVAPVSAYIEPKVGDYRLMAVLAPFRTEEEARAALIDAGGENVREWRR